MGHVNGMIGVINPFLQYIRLFAVAADGNLQTAVDRQIPAAVGAG